MPLNWKRRRWRQRWQRWNVCIAHHMWMATTSNENWWKWKCAFRKRKIFPSILNVGFFTIEKMVLYSQIISDYWWIERNQEAIRLNVTDTRIFEPKGFTHIDQTEDAISNIESREFSKINAEECWSVWLYLKSWVTKCLRKENRTENKNTDRSMKKKNPTIWS